nr:hypothetical protein [Tanacetum cinerariifolium]
MDLFNLISAPNPTKVKTETRPHVAHEVPLLTATASRVIDMGGTTVASGSSGTPAAIEKSPPNFADKDPPLVITERGNEATAKAILESGPEKEAAAMGPVMNKRCRKRGNKGVKANAPPKVLRKDHVASRPSQSTLRGKSMAAIEIEANSTGFAPATQKTPVNVSDPDTLSYTEPRPISKQDIAQNYFLGDDVHPTFLYEDDQDQQKATSMLHINFNDVGGALSSNAFRRAGNPVNMRSGTITPYGRVDGFS